MSVCLTAAKNAFATVFDFAIGSRPSFNWASTVAQEFLKNFLFKFLNCG